MRKNNIVMALLFQLISFWGCGPEDVSTGRTSQATMHSAESIPPPGSSSVGCGSCEHLKIYGTYPISSEEDLKSLQPYRTIDGSVIIRGQAFHSLANLGNTIESIGGDLIIEENDDLKDLEGLGRLSRVGGNIIIRENPKLSCIG
jgi:hypothetical protein